MQFILLLIIRIKVNSGQIKWNPIGNQAQIYKENMVGPVHNDILIAKMRPGHEIDVNLIAVKGIGKDHAKFSPVGNYRFYIFQYMFHNVIFTFEIFFMLHSYG